MRTQASTERSGLFFLLCLIVRNGGRSTCFRLRCPPLSSVRTPSSMVDRCTLSTCASSAAGSAQALRPSRTQKLSSCTTTNTWRASCCGARHPLRLAKHACVLPTAATRSGRLFHPRRRSHRSPGKIGNANTSLDRKVGAFSFCYYFRVILSGAKRSRRIRSPKRRLGGNGFFATLRMTGKLEVFRS